MHALYKYVELCSALSSRFSVTSTHPLKIEPRLEQRRAIQIKTTHIHDKVSIIKKFLLIHYLLPQNLAH